MCYFRPCFGGCKFKEKTEGKLTFHLRIPKIKKMFRLRVGNIEGKKIPFKVAKHVEKYELIYSKVLDDYYQHFSVI